MCLTDLKHHSHGRLSGARTVLASGLLVSVFAATAAAQQTLISDGFGDGDRDNDGVLEGVATDPADVGAAWYLGAGISDVAVGVANDDAGSGIGDGNALDFTSMTFFSRPLIANITPTTLANDGDRLSMKLTVRISEVPIDPNDAGLFTDRNLDRRIRIGMYNSNGTPVTGDTPDPDPLDPMAPPEITDDDTGYLMTVDAGTSEGNTLSILGDKADGILGGSSVSFGATDANPDWVVANDAVTLELILTRSGDDILVAGLFDGQLAEDGVAEFTDDIQAFGLPYTIDSVAFGVNGASLDYRVDNVEVIFTPAPTMLPTADGFEDADWNNDGVPDPDGVVNDSGDSGFAWTRATGRTSFDILLLDDTVVGGIGTGNAVNPFSFTTSTRVLAAAIDPIELVNTGDSVRFGFDYRNLFIENSDRQFRFGIHHDGGTPANESDTNLARNDSGYMVQLDTGPSAASTATVRGDLPNGLLSGSTRSLGGTSEEAIFALDDLEPHRLEIVVSRRFDPDLGRDVNDVVYFFDGQLATAGTDDGDDGNDAASGGPADPNATLTTSFNQIVFGTSGLDFLDYLVDNVTVEYIPASTEAASSDGFEDGDRDNDGIPEGTVNDAGDTGLTWYASRGTSDFNIQVVDESAGIGTGNALNGFSETTSSRVVSAAIQEVDLLADGDFINWSFDLRLNGAIQANTGNRFRFGIHDDGGTPVTGDGSTESTDDPGYMAWFDTGPSMSSTATVRGNPPGQLLSGGTRSLGGTSDDPQFALDDNDTRAIDLTIRNRFDAELGQSVIDVELYVDDVLVTDGTDAGDGAGDPTPISSRFNQVSIGTNSLAFLDWRIDNVEITTNVVPCDADLTGDRVADFFDVLAFGTLFDAMDDAADLDMDGMFTAADWIAYVALAEAGCP